MPGKLLPMIMFWRRTEVRLLYPLFSKKDTLLILLPLILHKQVFLKLFPPLAWFLLSQACQTLFLDLFLSCLIIFLSFLISPYIVYICINLNFLFVITVK